MNGEFPVVSGVENDALKVVPKGRVVQHPVGEAPVSRDCSQDGQFQLRRLHPQLEKGLALRHPEVPEVGGRADANEHVIPKCERQQESGDVKLQLAMLVSWNLEPVLGSVWDRDWMRRGRTYTEFSGSLLFLTQRCVSLITTSVEPSARAKR